jgi:hypothetical protein
MNIEALDRCLQLFRHLQNEEKDKIRILSDIGTEFSEELVEPFRRELGVNLLSKSSSQEKRDLIIFYMEELDRTIYFDRDFNEIEPLHPESDNFLYPIWYQDQDETDDMGVALVRAQILFSYLFEVIQDYCNIYHIPFIELCKERHFLLNTIDLQPTFDFQELDHDLQAISIPVDAKQSDKPIIKVGKPVFTQEFFDEVFILLRDFFSPEDEAELAVIMETGADSERPLVFMDAGNRLADTFKQLYEANIILGCQKKELESWICRNFKYLNKNIVKPFIPKYLNEIISTNKDKCSRPLINVKFDKSLNKNILIKL